MAVPDFQTVMLPLLKLAGDQQEHAVRSTVDRLTDELSLTESDRREALPSSRQPTFDNRVGWALTYLKKAGLLEATRRLHFRVTARALEVLGGDPPSVDIGFLKRYPEFRARRNTSENGKSSAVTGEVADDDEGKTPEEAIEHAHQQLRNDLAADLLQQIMDCSPAFFERLVIDVLLRMGYGGTRTDAGQAIGRSGDGGIDGIIKEDRLGLDVIYIQAKRWEGSVGRPEIQKFAGALQGQRARKGIFLTTSSFTSDAVAYAGMIENKLVLIDGERLAKLMIDHDVGVSATASYEIKKVDSDYFTEG